jgi:hypothetical protein
MLPEVYNEFSTEDLVALYCLSATLDQIAMLRMAVYLEILRRATS